MQLRKHQAELETALRSVATFPTTILAHVVPGGGKSALPAIAAQNFPNHRIGWFVPRLALRRQAALDTQSRFGISIRESGNDINPSRGTRGFVATHQALSQSPDLWRDEFARHRYILVVDELHHFKIDREGSSNSFARALAELRADVVLSMTGTLETNDSTLIHMVKYAYNTEGWIACPYESANIFIRYSRADALEECAIVPIEFRHFDGPVKFFDGQEEVKTRAAAADWEHRADIVFTILRTDMANQLLDSTVTHWREHGRKLLVVVDSQKNAEIYKSRLEQCGIRVGLAISDNNDAHDEIKSFKKSEGFQALVTCAMAYEGLDVPDITHIACLTHIRSTPWIEQMLGRAWRSAPGKSQCWAFVPDDPLMNYVIEKIQKEQLSVVKSAREREGNGTGNGERERRVLALDSSTDAVRSSGLDDLSTVDEEHQILDIVMRKGLTGDEPELRALFLRLRKANVPQKNEQTVEERLVNLRKQITDIANENDAYLARVSGVSPKFGTTLKQLFKRTEKSIVEMTEQELIRAFAILQKLCAR